MNEWVWFGLIIWFIGISLVLTWCNWAKRKDQELESLDWHNKQLRREVARLKDQDDVA